MSTVSSASMHSAKVLRGKEKELNHQVDHTPLVVMRTSMLQSSLSLACRISRSLVCFCTDSEETCRWHSLN